MIFQGIKYADSSRWEHSTLNSWGSLKSGGVHDFSAPGKSCVIAGGVNVGDETLPVTTDRAEDCLYAKIYARKDAVLANDSRNVLSWIHGGTFNYGGVDVAYEDVSSLVADQDIIVAKVNYRLGPYGNWYWGDDDCNYQTKDQQNGLNWIHSNIARFNGDKDNITLGGASAGGRGVLHHMTTESSYGYFKNAMTIGAVQIPFWKAAHAQQIYAQIGGYVDLLADEQTKACIGAYGQKFCLKMAPHEALSAQAAQLGQLFAKFAIDNGLTTQMESAWGPVIDGTIISDEPLFKIESGDVKQDLGFYYHEVGRNEGQTMMRKLFSNPMIRNTLFGEETAAQIWQTGLNDHVVMPKAAYDGCLGGIYKEAAPYVIGNVIGSELECPLVETFPASHPLAAANGLLTECLDKMADWATAYMWSCRSTFVLKNANFGSNTKVYATELHASKEGPDHGQEGVQLADVAEMVDCYDAGRGKSCHIQGQPYFFGEYKHQNTEVTSEQAAFQATYQGILAGLIKTGASALPNFSSQPETGIYTELRMGEAFTYGIPFPRVCTFHENVYRALRAQGAL